MSSGKSESSSSSTTQSTQEDNRVAVENGGIALGKDAALVLNDQFSDNVLSAFNQLVSLVKDAGQVVVKNTDAANQQSQATVAAVTAALQDAKLGTSAVFQNMIPLIIGAVVLVLIFGMLFNRKAK